MKDTDETLADTVRDILGSGPTNATGAADGWAPDRWRALVAADLDGIGIAEHLGGSGGDLGDALVAVRAAAASGAALPLAECLFGANPAFALVGARRPSGLTVSTAFASGFTDGVALRVPFARSADSVLVLIDEATSVSPARLALYSGDAVSVSPHRNVADEARDDVDFSAGSPLEQWTIAAADLVRLRQLAVLARAAQIGAAGAQVLALTVRYANEREQFGRPIAKFQAVAHNIALLSGETAIAAAAVDAAFAVVEGAGVDADGDAEHVAFAVAAAKARVSRGAGEVSRIAHQVFGALGFTQEHPLHQLTRRLLAWRDECGSDGRWDAEVGRAVLSAGADGFWPLLSSGGPAG